MAAATARTASAVTVPKHIVVVGAGIQGTSVAYHLAQQRSGETSTKITLLESQSQPAMAASGKGGGFMARSWGDGSPTQSLHHVAFDMYEQLAKELGCTSYRKIPVLSVAPSRDGKSRNTPNNDVSQLIPSWLDGSTGRISPMGYGDDTAQITPSEFVHAMLRHAGNRIQVVHGTCVGVEMQPVTDESENGQQQKVTAVRYSVSGADDDDADSSSIQTIEADCVVVSAGPWSCAAEDWFHKGKLQLPMEGIKSTSIVWKNPSSSSLPDATALFCGENNRFGTHLEVYPRPDGTIYICGIGGSDYISRDELKDGAFREVCNANDARVKAAMAAFQEMSQSYQEKGELERSQACMRPCPPDAMPYMGAIPGYEGAYINAGHNCWGIAWAPACGLAMSELILEGESSTIDLSPFDPCRFTPSLKGSRGRKRRGASVGEQW
ncbi:hypothetical protein ACA910_004979 [Epithemia clementina (nom. ined.)]